MTVTQVATLMNTVTQELLGKTGLVAENLENVVDVGVEVFNGSDVDHYVKSLVNHIGRMIFVDRAYRGGAPSVLMDGWEFGSVLEKVQADMPDASENESWNLVNGQSYDDHVFYQPKVSAKFFNKRVTFEVRQSFTEKQVKESFSNAQQLNAFISMIYNAVDRAMTVKTDALIMRTINNFIAETIYGEYSGGTYTDKSGVRAVNLLYSYNAANATALSAAEAVTDPKFIRYAAYIIKLYATRMAKMSSLFNMGGKERFTPRDDLKIVMLADFKDAADVYLQSDTFHDEFTKLPAAEPVAYWQGSGTDYSFANTSAVNVTTSEGNTVNVGGVLAVMFDRNALGVTNYDRRVTTQYTASAEFFTNWFKMDAGYFNDFNENFIVFFAA